MKSMKRKRIVSCSILFLVWITIISIFTGCTTSEKIPIPKVENGIYIYDEDNVIDDDVETQLNGMLVDLEEQTGTEFAVISVESLLDKSIEDYANNLFNTLGIGKKGEDNGILLLFSRNDERVRLEIGRGLESCLNDAKCGRILDDYFVPYRESDEYSKATELTVKAVLQVLAEEYQITIQGLDELPDGEINSDETLSIGDIITIALGVIIYILLILFIISGIIYLISGDDFYDDEGSSGGFFSGGSSFGGGFSGGGGASR